MAAKEKKLIAFPVYPGVTPLDLVGPLTVLRNMARTPYRTVVVGERVRTNFVGQNRQDFAEEVRRITDGEDASDAHVPPAGPDVLRVGPAVHEEPAVRGEHGDGAVDD